MLSNPRYLDASKTRIGVVLDGRMAFIPADSGNADYADLLASGQEIAPYIPPAPTAEDVRAECRRRMRLALGARDDSHLDVLISNASREAIRLLRKGAASWNAEEQLRSDQLAMGDRLIEALRASSRTLEDNPPADYNDDARWRPSA